MIKVDVVSLLSQVSMLDISVVIVAFTIYCLCYTSNKYMLYNFFCSSFLKVGMKFTRTISLKPSSNVGGSRILLQQAKNMN